MYIYIYIIYKLIKLYVYIFMQIYLNVIIYLYRVVAILQLLLGYTNINRDGLLSIRIAVVKGRNCCHCIFMTVVM